MKMCFNVYLKPKELGIYFLVWANRFAFFKRHGAGRGFLSTQSPGPLISVAPQKTCIITSFGKMAHCLFNNLFLSFCSQNCQFKWHLLPDLTKLAVKRKRNSSNSSIKQVSRCEKNLLNPFKIYFNSKQIHFLKFSSKII